MDHSKTLLLAAALTAGTAALAAGAECGGMCAAAKAPRFDLRWEHRFVFEAERDLPDGYAFLPAAHYSATVEKLPAEMRFAREDETVARFAAPTNVAPPYVMHLMANGAQKPSVFVTKDGETSLAYIAGWPKGFEPRTAVLTNALRLAVSDGMRDPKASLSAGIGQADTRFVTWGRTNRPYVEDGRLFFTFSARAYGAYLGVMSFNPNACDFRLEGIILFDYGDGLLRNDLAADLFYDDEAKEWRAYVSNFSTGTDSLDGRAKGGVNVAWSKACPLRGVSVMRAKSLGLDGMNEDPDGYWDAGAGKWRLLVSEFTAKGIRASLLESDNWDGPFRRIAGPVAEDSTGTTLAVVDGRLRALAGSADRALYIYDYPTLERVGQLNVPRPTWEISSSANGRSWPAYAELPDGRRLLLTFDRANFAGMPEPNWTYGGLYLYGNGLARGCRSAYSVAILGDTHYDAEPESAYHSHYDESNRWAKVQHAEFRRNGEMWRGRCRDLVAASARLAREKPTDFVLQLGDLVQGDCDDVPTHKRMLDDCIRTLCAPYPAGLPFLTVAGNHDVRGKGARQAYFEFAEAYLSRQLGRPVKYPVLSFRWGGDLWVLCDFEARDLAPLIAALEAVPDARHTFVVTHGPFTPSECGYSAWRLAGSGKCDARRPELYRILSRRHAIVLSGHTHTTAWFRHENEFGGFTEFTANSVWAKPELATAEPVCEDAAEYGRRVAAMGLPDGERAAFDAAAKEFRPGLRGYYLSLGAGHARLNVSETEVTVDYYPGATDVPARTFRMK